MERHPAGGARLPPARSRPTAATRSSATTSGLVAYLDGEPVGWCAVEPRTAYPRLPHLPRRVEGARRGQADDSVWAVTCFVTRAGFRRRGISRALARAAVELRARARRPRARGLPDDHRARRRRSPGASSTSAPASIFEAAGFTEVANPTLRRVVMRIDF